MNSDSNRSDLASLKRDLERVEMDLRFLRVKADQIETRIVAAEKAAEPPIAVAPPSPPPEPIPEPIVELPPIIQEAPPVIEEFVVPTPAPASEPLMAAQTFVTPEPPPFAAPPAVVPVEEPASFEMRLGTFWFVRVGIVMVLTAMVFLGNYAYQHYIPRLGPAAKVGLLYGASFGLLGLGWFLPRKQEKLKNYGQVLFAGGLAAVYFTTYAAYHFPHLQIITSAVLDGVLLLIWTGFIVWMADRKKSEVLAVFAIGLAYYTALITNVGSFTLLSNLLLAAAAVFFLIRNRWVNLSFMSLLASYGSYFYWRYYAGAPGIDDQSARLALGGYWTIFTAAVFLTRHPDFQGVRRASFLSFNNGAAFALLAFSFFHEHSRNLWQLSLYSGALFMALALAARRFLAEDDFSRRAYLAQGILLTTLGVILKLTGPTLSLVLAMESAMLVIFSTQWNSRLLRNAAALIALLAGGWLLAHLNAMQGAPGWWKGAGIFGLLLFNAAWTGRHTEEGDPLNFRPLPSYYTMLGLFCWITVVFSLGHADSIGLILSLTGLALTGTIYTVRVREIALLSQGLVAVAQAQTFYFVLQSTPQFIWSPLAVILSSIALSLWWKKQTALVVDPNSSLFAQLISAFAGAAIVYAWLPQEIHGDNWILAAIASTIVWTAFAAWMRSWPLAAAGQIFILGTSLMTLFGLIDKDGPGASYVTALIVALVALAASPRLLKFENAELKLISHIYQWLATALMVGGVVVHADPSNRFLYLSALSALSTLAAMFGARYLFAPGVALIIAGFFCWVPTWEYAGAEVQHLLAILIFALMQFVARKNPHRLPIADAGHSAWIVAISSALWIYVSRWVIVHSAGAHFYLTASWALLAFVFFIAGFSLRERTYRWAALAVLGCALGRVVLLDVWQLQTIYRILSFLALGIVLLALGYIYTRFQDRIAKWL